MTGAGWAELRPVALVIFFAAVLPHDCAHADSLVVVDAAVHPACLAE